MTLNRVKLGRAVTFIKYLASVVTLIFLPKTLIWSIKLTEFCRAGRKLAYQKYLRKILPIFLFLSNLSLLILKNLRGYN